MFWLCVYLYVMGAILAGAVVITSTTQKLEGWAVAVNLLVCMTWPVSWLAAILWTIWEAVHAKRNATANRRRVGPRLH